MKYSSIRDFSLVLDSFLVSISSYAKEPRTTLD
nr:MAG TPA: hypothetical protein [Caudoviricetes sp.]